MPRLSDAPNIRLSAVIALVMRYMADLDFRKEFNQVCQPYLHLIKYFTLEFLDKNRDAVSLTNSEYQSLVSNLENKIEEEQRKFPNIKMNKPDPVQACIEDLDRLAYRWKLRISEAGFFLFIEKVAEEVKSFGIEMRVGQSFHPYLSFEVPPLKLRDIPGWLVTEMDRRQLLNQLRKAIASYYDGLKKRGLAETPSRLDQHADWWFRHYVHKKKYSELEEPYPSANQESIKRAVWRFTKLVGISSKDQT